jgi:UDP-N-acetylmuramate dehydrogenase
VLSELDSEAMAFGYDTSRLQKSGEVLVWAEFGMTHSAPEALRRVARASLAHRKLTQPLALPSAGCLFQNPDAVRDKVPEGIPASAGALIDRAGLKGFRVGGATISSVHANFVVNDGTATAADVRAVAEAAREAVKRKFGVTLRDEVVYLGNF